jgi:PAS domain S-box-containing protein
MRALKEVYFDMADLNIIGDQKTINPKDPLALDDGIRSALFDSLCEELVHLDMNMEVLWANRSACKSAGIDLGELKGRHCFEIWSKRDRPCSGCPLIQSKETGEPHTGEQTHGGRCFKVKGIPVKDDNGSVRSFLRVALDITETRETKKSLQETKACLRALVENLDLGITMIDRGLNIIQSNEASLWIGTPAPVELPGYKCYQALKQRDDICPDCPAVEAMSTGEPVALESEKIRGADTSHLKIQAFPTFGSKGEVSGCVKVVQDVTYERKAEEDRENLEKQLLQSQKMEAIGTLAGGIAHDFNNLLQAVLGYSDLLILKGKRDGFGQHELMEIRKAAERASELTKQLLTFSRKVESSLRPVDLNHEIGQVFNILNRTIPKMIGIDLFLEDNLKTINADPAQMEQVIMNLVLNAKDAMPEGGKLIIETQNLVLDEEYCRRHLKSRPGEYVLMAISDNGHGMDQKTLERIFEPFYTTKGVGTGTGLGLAMVYGIVKSHGGRITCYSSVGTGTTFKIYLPALARTDVKRGVEGDQELIEGGHETILLVDDEDFIRDFAEQVLTRSGYTVHTASNGEEALGLYRKMKQHIDLVILDLIMPGMGGAKCLEEIIHTDPDTKVIITSGYSGRGPALEAARAGASGFMDKPYGVRHMLRTIREVLDK